MKDRGRTHPVCNLLFFLFLIVSFLTIGNFSAATELDEAAAANLVSNATGGAVIIPDTYTSIGALAFKRSTLTSITIPNSVTVIGPNAFQFCNNLTTVTLGNSVETIAGTAFMGCGKLTSIAIPSSVTTIGDNAFNGCSSLASVTFSASSQLDTIGQRAFYGISASLTAITIPDSVTTIAMEAFPTVTSAIVLISAGETSAPAGFNADAFPNATLTLAPPPPVFESGKMFKAIADSANISLGMSTGSNDKPHVKPMDIITITGLSSSGASSLEQDQYVSLKLTGLDSSNNNAEVSGQLVYAEMIGTPSTDTTGGITRSKVGSNTTGPWTFKIPSSVGGWNGAVGKPLRIRVQAWNYNNGTFQAISGSDAVSAYAIIAAPIILKPKVRQSLKNNYFGDLPNNPTMTQLETKDLDSVRHLNLRDLGETTDKVQLDGIVEHLPEVESIDLTKTEFDSLQALDGHPKLKHLTLNHGPIRTSAQLDALFEKSNGTPIDLPELEALYLNDTGFSQVDQLAHFGKLKQLYLKKNGIDQSSGTDPLLGLESLVSLEHLDISQNPAINDISEIKKLYQAKIQAAINKDHQNWGVGAAPTANQVAMDHEDWHSVKPYLRVEAEETSISASDSQELVDMGIIIFTLPKEEAKINLRRGINMIGLPLDNRENMTAQNFIDWFIRTRINSSQIVETKANVTGALNNLNWSHSGILERLAENPALVDFKLSVLPIDERYFDYIPVDIYKGSDTYNAGGNSTSFFVYDSSVGTLIPVIKDYRAWVPIATSAGSMAGGLKIQDGAILNASGNTAANPVHTSVPYLDADNWVDQNSNGWDDRGLAELLAEADELVKVKTILDDAEQTIRYQYLLGIRASFNDQNGSGSQGVHVMFAYDENQNLKLTRYTDVGWIVRYQSEIDSATGEVAGGFETYLPNLDRHHSEGFPVRGKEAYIVHVGSNRVIDFHGQAWADSISPQQAPSAATSTNTWAFLVAGKLTTEVVAADDQYTLRVTNLNSGKQLAKVKHQGHSFRLPLVDLSRQDVVAEGDLVKVEVVGEDGQRLADGQFVVGQQEIAAAYRLVKIQYNPVPELTRLLQNYPNPFNPETWIPFELNQDAEVLIKIYDVTGHLIRTLPVGFQPAGIYSSRTKAAYWDGKTETGETVASGIYFYNITIGDYSQTRRMVILK